MNEFLCVGVRAWWERGHRARQPCCISGCSLFSSVSMVTGAAAPFWVLAWLCRAACPPVCLPRPPSHPPAQPWELPALRPPAAHRPCQAGRKKACLLTPSTWLLGHRGSAQKMSGPGHREVGLEPGCLQPREIRLAGCCLGLPALPASRQACRLAGSGGPRETLSESFLPLPACFTIPFSV